MSVFFLCLTSLRPFSDLFFLQASLFARSLFSLGLRKGHLVSLSLPTCLVGKVGLFFLCL